MSAGTPSSISIKVSSPKEGNGSATAASGAVSSESGEPAHSSFDVQLWDRFDAVAKRVLRGRHELKVAHAFFEHLAAAEMSHSRALAKTASHTEDFSTSASVSRCFSQVVRSIEGLKVAYSRNSTDITTQMSAKLSALVDEIKERVTKMQSRHRNLCRELADLRSNYDRRREGYRSAVERVDSATRVLLEAKKAGKAIKEIQRRLKDVDSAKKAKVQARQKLLKTVLQLRAQQVETRTDTEAMLKELEALERKRVRAFSELTSFYVKMTTDMTTVLCRFNEKLQAENKLVDADADIDAAVTVLKTDKPHPALVTMEMAVDGIDDLSHITMPSTRQTTALSDGDLSDAGSDLEHELELAEIDPAKLSDRIAVTLCDFEAEEKGELSFRKGDQFDLIDAPEGADWWKGEHNGAQGRFPAGLVRRQNEVPAPHLVSREYEVLWDFEPENPDELAIFAKDIVEVSMVLNGWAIGRVKTRYGQAEKGKAGLFPLEYLDAE